MAKSSYSMFSKVSSSLFGKVAEAFAYLPQHDNVVNQPTGEVATHKTLLISGEDKVTDVSK